MASKMIHLGDKVEIRVLLRRRRGRVVDVPGISSIHRQFEFNGMRWVAIRTPEMIIGRDESNFDPPPPGGPERDSNCFDN